MYISLSPMFPRNFIYDLGSVWIKCIQNMEEASGLVEASPKDATFLLVGHIWGQVHTFWQCQQRLQHNEWSFFVCAASQSKPN